MRTSLLHLAAAIAALALVSACGTSTSGKAGGGTADGDSSAVGGGDSGGGGAGDSAAGGEVSDSGNTGGGDATTNSDAKADTGGGQDAGKDTAVEPVDDKCDPKDQTCLVSCRNDKCSKEVGACTGNSKCVQFNGCLGGCAQTPPVSPPAEVTGTTCVEKCQTLAGKEAFDTYGAVALCVKAGCVKSAYTPGQPCAQTDEACLQDCLVEECSDETKACDSDKDCTKIFQCLGGCGGNNQACAQGCIGAAPAPAQGKFQAMAQCMLTFCISQ